MQDFNIVGFFISIESYAFIQCSGLTTLDVSSYNTANVTFSDGSSINSSSSGIVGISYGTEWPTILNCYNTGNITEFLYAFAERGKVINSYSSGNTHYGIKSGTHVYLTLQLKK